MPYQAGKNLPSEKASKLGHLEVLKSSLVQKLVASFEQPSKGEETDTVYWESFPSAKLPLDIIFSVDGSWQPIQDETPPYKALAFIKTALLRLDQIALNKIDRESPHPFELRDLMADSALYHATVFPLRHIKVPGVSVSQAVRQIIYESLKDDSLNGEPIETLKWLAYEKWSGKTKSLPPFQCPHCESNDATLPYDAEKGNCPTCGKEIFISDMLGFHLEMAEEAARETVASAYMNIHELLLLFTGVRHFWETNRQILRRCLFLKDGPLQLRAHYSKLVAPIRRFFLFALEQNVPIYLIGQEKTGTFVDYLNLIGRNAPANHIFIPNHEYICEEIQHRSSNTAYLYGQDTNYGAKAFVTIGERYRFVLTIPVSCEMKNFISNPRLDNVIGLSRILQTLPNILSSKHENGLLPIELANAVASLSTYPSAQVLKLFAESSIPNNSPKR
ncbi:MAG: hypothetical protein AB1757_01440 [Acidobacteriota bacterium]